MFRSVACTLKPDSAKVVPSAQQPAAVSQSAVADAFADGAGGRESCDGDSNRGQWISFPTGHWTESLANPSAGLWISTIQWRDTGYASAFVGAAPGGLGGCR